VKPSAAETKSAEAKPAETKTATAPPETDKKAPGSSSAAAPGTPGDRGIVDLPLARMNAARDYAQQKRTDTASGVFQAAESLKKDGTTALSGKKYVDARCAFVVAERIYRMFAADNDDDDRIEAILKYVGKLRENATVAWNNIPADPLFRDAQDRVVRGDAARAKKDWIVAAREYAAAAFDYEKIWWAAQPGTVK